MQFVCFACVGGGSVSSQNSQLSRSESPLRRHPPQYQSPPLSSHPTTSAFCAPLQSHHDPSGEFFFKTFFNLTILQKKLFYEF